MTYLRRALGGFWLLWALPSQAASMESVQLMRQVCEQSFTECVSQVDAVLAQTESGGVFWRELMLLKLDSLFLLQQDEALMAVTNELVLRSELPEYFRARIYIYHAKELVYHGNLLQGRHYVDKASELLQGISDSTQNPLTEIRLVNVRMYLNEDREQNYARLQSLELRYRRSHDWMMKYDLYNNLGHLSQFLDKRDEALHYRALAVDAATHTKNLFFQAEGLYNFARLRTKYQDFHPEIIPLFSQSLEKYQQLDNQIMVAHCHLFLAELYWHLQQYPQAQQQLAEVNPKLVAEYNLEHLKRIQALVHSVKK